MSLTLKVKPLLHMQAVLLLTLKLTMPRRHKLRHIAAFAGAGGCLAGASWMPQVAEAVPSLLPVDFDKYKFSKILASSVSLRHCALAPAHRPHSLQTMKLLLTKPLPPSCCG